MLSGLINALYAGKDKSIKQIASIGRKYKTLRYPILLFLAVYIFIYNFTLHFCRYINMKERMAKAVAFTMCFVMLISSINITAFAFSDIESVENISSELPEDELASDEEFVEDEVIEESDVEEDNSVTEDSSEAEEKVNDDSTKNETSQNNLETDDTDDKEIADTEGELNEDSLAFEQKATIDDVEITVKADPDVFPKGAFLTARKVNDIEEKSIAYIVNRDREDKKPDIVASYRYGIVILDKNGNIIQPDLSKGKATITFKMQEIADEDLETGIFYIEKDGIDYNAISLDVDTDEGEEDEAIVETPGFLYFNVEFVKKDNKDTKKDGDVANDKESKEDSEDKKDLEETEDKEDLEEDEEESEIDAAFKQSVTVDGVIVTVSAEEDVFPSDAIVTVRKVTSSEENNISYIVDKSRDKDMNVALSYTFDIIIYDKNGNPIQPNTEKGSVWVSFKTSEISNENLQTDVYHIEHSGNVYNAVSLDVSTEEGTENVAVVETTGFSYYSVEFTYNKLQYVLEGDEKVALSTILEAVKIEENGEITNVVSSNPELFNPILENRTWYIEALQPFDTTELLKVSIGEIEYEIVVTDDQINVSSWDNLKTALATSNTDTITLEGDVTAPGSGSGTLEVNGTKTLDLNGYVIDANKKFRVFNVKNGATLTLMDGNPSSAHSDSNLPAGGVITGGDTSAKYEFGGSGINVESNATFNMYGGTIYNNKGFSVDGGDYRYNNGGGVRNQGTFNMYGGAIWKNTGKYGAGVLLVDNGTFTMSGGSITENRTYNQGNGAGVYLKGGTFKMTGGVITDNKGSWSGGGVYVPEKGFLDTNTKISITLGGTAQIYNNKGYQDDSNRTAEHNLYIQPTGPTDKAVPDSIIHIATGDEAPTDGMNVHVFVAEYSNYLTVASPIQITHTNGEDYSKYFTPDVTNRRIGNLDNNQLYWGIPSNITNATHVDNKDTNNGYIEVDKSQAIYQEEVNVTVHPNPGYVLGSLKFNNTDITGDKKFNMPGSAVTVTATFSRSTNPVTVHFNNGLYDGFAPYWKVDDAPDGTLKYGEAMSFPTDFKNVGYTLAGWTTTAPTAGSTSSATYTGATMTVEQVNALYEQSRTSGEVTLYAVWERDTINTAWNATRNKLYSTNGLRAAIEDTTTLQNDDKIYILKDHELTDSGAKYEIKKNNIIIDGGVYKYDATNNNKLLGGTDATNASHGDKSRYTVKFSGNYGGHTFEYRGATNATFQNLVLTKGSNYPNKSNGFFWLNGETGASRAANETLTLKNVEIYDLGANPSDSGTALIGAGQYTSYLILEDCYFHDNTSEGGIFIAGRTETRTSGQGNGDTIVTLKGNTIIKNNKVNNVEMNIKIETPVNTENGVHLHIDDSFSGRVGVYLPTAKTLIGALCKDRAIALSLINNGNVTSDQNYKLAPLTYNYDKNGYASGGAIRIAKPATLTFNTNGSTSGSLPTKAMVDGTETTITNNALDIYLGAEVILPGSGTLAKDNLAFAGWNTNIGGTGTDYISGETYTVSETDTTLYAVWEEHFHSWKTFVADGKLITYCTTPGCKHYATNDNDGKTSGISLTILGTSQTHTGNETGIELGTTKEQADWNAAGMPVPTIKYKGRGQTTYPEVGSESVIAPKEVGTYTALITVNGETFEVDFEITSDNDPKDPVIEKNEEIDTSNGEPPVESASLDNSVSELLDAPNIFEPSEKTDIINNGVDAKVILRIKNINPNEISTNDKTKMESEAKKALGNNVSIRYMDISLYKKVGGNPEEKITEPGQKISITIEIPEGLLIKENGKVRKYVILQLHNGATNVIKGTFNKLTNEYTFKTDKFSTYAIAYNDIDMDIEISTHGNSTNIPNIGGTLQLNVRVTPYPEADQSVRYISSDEKVATVDENGKITGVGVGTAVITVITADGSVLKQITITVGQKASVPVYSPEGVKSPKTSDNIFGFLGRLF